MFKRKSKKNKESLSLLENEDEGKVVMQNWLPQSAGQAPNQQEQEMLRKTPFSKDDQRILSMDVQRPQRQSWTTFAKNNPFEEDTAPGGVGFQADAWPEGNTKSGVEASVVNNSTKVTHKQSFSYDNPFISQGNPLNMKTTTTLTINQPLQTVQHGAGASFFGPPGVQQAQISTSESVFDPLAQSQFSQNARDRSSWIQQPSQFQFQTSFQKLEKCMSSKNAYDGEPSVSSSSEEDNKSEGVQKKKSKKKKKKKSKKMKKSKKVESSSEEESDSSSSDSESLNGKKTGKTDALAELFRGVAMLKFPRRKRAYPHFKYIQLTKSKRSLYLQWFSKKKPLSATTIDIACMDTVLQGRKSEAFRRHQKEELKNLSFSIIYDRVNSLDLLANDATECKMWVNCLKELIKRSKKGQKVASIEQVWITGLVYVNKFLPKSKLSVPPKRANMVRWKDRNVDPRQHDKNNASVLKLRARYHKLENWARHDDVKNSAEYENLRVSLTDLAERLEELVAETRDSGNSVMSKRDISKFTVYLESLEEKTKVLQSNKNFVLT